MKSLLAASLIMLASISPTSAQFMKPGASPESGFAGIWRVIDAKPAPWGRASGTQSFPLLEYAIEFADGTVKGPNPLACEHARFSSGVTSQDDLFDGKGHGKDSAAKALHLTSFSVTTYRVVCGGATRDYYVDDNAALVVSEGDAIYTLERPTGMDPKQYTPGFSGPSFDCGKARSAIEHAICRDAALSKSDRKLNDAYLRLRSTETPESFATVQRAQHDWLAYVTKSCAGGSAQPTDQQPLQGCLDDNLADRADRLDAARVFKAGSLILEPRMRVMTRAKPETEESDIYPWMSGGPEADAFNAYVSNTLALSKRRMDDKDLFPFGNEVGELKLYAHRTYSVTRFDVRIASLQVSTFDYTGGAHEVIAERSINWDVARRKPFTLDDVFDKSKPWRKFVVDFCVKDLRDDNAAEQGADPDPSAVESVVKDGGNWLWGEEAATVHFSVYTIASFSGGESDVEIPYDELKPFLRADASPLRPSTTQP